MTTRFLDEGNEYTPLINAIFGRAMHIIADTAPLTETTPAITYIDIHTNQNGTPFTSPVYRLWRNGVVDRIVNNTPEEVTEDERTTVAKRDRDEAVTAVIVKHVLTALAQEMASAALKNTSAAYTLTSSLGYTTFASNYFADRAADVADALRNLAEDI